MGFVPFHRHGPTFKQRRWQRATPSPATAPSLPPCCCPQVRWTASNPAALGAGTGLCWCGRSETNPLLRPPGGPACAQLPLGCADPLCLRKGRGRQLPPFSLPPHPWAATRRGEGRKETNDILQDIPQHQRRPGGPRRTPVTAPLPQGPVLTSGLTPRGGGGRTSLPRAVWECR